MFSELNSVFATTSEDACVKIWNLDSGNLVYDLKGHTLTTFSIVFTQNGYITGGIEQFLCVFTKKGNL